MIGSSKLDNKIKERYEIASNNSRLLGTEQAIEMALTQSKLTEAEKKLIRGTFASVRASEPVPDFKALTEIDSIVAASALPLEIKEYYLSASTKIAALTVDFIIVVKLIKDNQKLTPAQQEKYREHPDFAKTLNCKFTIQVSTTQL
ncbi:hypothetical protein NDA07_26200 [Microcoleus vaginatus DQ-U2]